MAEGEAMAEQYVTVEATIHDEQTGYFLSIAHVGPGDNVGLTIWRHDRQGDGLWFSVSRALLLRVIDGMEAMLEGVQPDRPAGD